MRLLASLTAAAALLATAAPAAQSIERTFRVPYAGCEITIEVNDVTVAMNGRSMRVERSGESRVRTNC